MIKLILLVVAYLITGICIDIITTGGFTIDKSDSEKSKADVIKHMKSAVLWPIPMFVFVFVTLHLFIQSIKKFIKQ